MSDFEKLKKEIKLSENIPVDYEFEKMLKSFMKQVQKDGILQEFREHRYYTKPSAIRHKIERTIKRKRELTRRRKRRK